MRILIAGRIEFEGEICAWIIRGGREHILASRQEKGCVSYVWSVDPLEPGVLHVFEEWESETDLARISAIRPIRRCARIWKPSR